MREAVDEDIVNTKKTAMKSKILSHHNGLLFIQAMDVLRMHRSKIALVMITMTLLVC